MTLCRYLIVSGNSSCTDEIPMFEGAHFTKHGSMLDVNLYSEPTSLISNGPTRMIFQAACDEDGGYLVPISREQLDQV